MADEYYNAFIKEAFIDPIRSVLIVDDDYPTLDEVLNAELAKKEGEEKASNKAWHQNPERIKRAIEKFRRRNPPLLVDIHDGANVGLEGETDSVRHLHQCDLLVLDYELDSSKPGDGERAIEILRSLMSNKHFNLVIVYTRKTLDHVFNEVLWGLIAPSSDSLSPGETEKAEELIEEGEDNSEGFEKRLSESVGDAQYFYSRRCPKTYLRTMSKGGQPYSDFKRVCCSVGLTRDDRRLILRYLLKKFEGRLIGKGSETRTADLLWSSDSVRWIKSDSIFVAFSEKSDDDDLLSELQAALNAWSPEPSVLFLTKLRAEMDEYGIAAQGQALENRRALAYWYHSLLCTADESDQRWRAAESVSRHSEQLMDVVLPGVECFVLSLIKAEGGGDNVRICKGHFGVDLAKSEVEKISMLEHNAFVCSKYPEGWHLTTGHIFVMCGEHWICLSPACDMVPSQASGDRLPFIAVQLQKMRDGKMPSDIQTNRYVFIRIDGTVKGFCYNDPSRDGSAPLWEVLYAEKNGEFLGEDFRFTVSRIKQGKTRPTAKRYKVEVVGQLRYEYALNLIQKLGVSLTRVGLDFAG